MDKLRFEEVDPLTGIITRWWVNPEDDTVTTQTINPHTANILDRNREMEAASHGQSFGDGKIVATVPSEMLTADLYKAIQEQDETYLKRFLNDSDNAKFRTFRGKV